MCFLKKIHFWYHTLAEHLCFQRRLGHLTQPIISTSPRRTLSTTPFRLPRSRTKDSLVPRQFLADKAEGLEPADAKAAALQAAAVWLRTCFVGSGTKRLSDASRL